MYCPVITIRLYEEMEIISNFRRFSFVKNVKFDRYNLEIEYKQKPIIEMIKLLLIVS